MIIYDHILNEDTCASLINDFEKNNKHHLKHRDTLVLPLQNNKDKFISKLSYIYTSYLNSKSLLFVPEKIEIVKWPIKAKQDSHKDKVRPTTKLTSITYLNDNFKGGKTCLENGIEITPKTGDVIFFDGNEYSHWVTEVEKNTRYTLAMWYTNNLDLIYI
jgi:hypothetical protein